MTNYYIVKEIEELLYQPMLPIGPEAAKLLDHPLRQKILQVLSTRAMYPSQLAKELRLHEQKVYYHMNLLTKASLLEIVDREEIRGTVAKRYRSKGLNFGMILEDHWKSITELTRERPLLHPFFNEFIHDSVFTGRIVVGSPDPHGSHKARARDGHYAIDLALFFGGLGQPGKEFSTQLDVDVSLKTDQDLIVVGGPVTNLVCGKINKHLPVSFSEQKPWGIRGRKAVYTEDTNGLIAKIPHPFSRQHTIMVIAGIRFIGTKAAVMALTRETSLVLNRFTGQRTFYCIVQGYDLDGDGKIDSIEVVE